MEGNSRDKKICIFKIYSTVLSQVNRQTGQDRETRCNIELRTRPGRSNTQLLRPEHGQTEKSDKRRNKENENREGRRGNKMGE
jgi:hypothetical protein